MLRDIKTGWEENIQYKLQNTFRIKGKNQVLNQKNKPSGTLSSPVPPFSRSGNYQESQEV